PGDGGELASRRSGVSLPSRSCVRSRWCTQARLRAFGTIRVSVPSRDPAARFYRVADFWRRTGGPLRRLPPGTLRQTNGKDTHFSLALLVRPTAARNSGDWNGRTEEGYGVPAVGYCGAQE